MASELHIVTRFHPDTIEVPGDPDRLRSGADGVQDLVNELGDVAKRLRSADAPQESRGPTVRAVSRVAGMLGRVLEADGEQLSDVAELARRQAERLTEAQEAVEDVRRRWRQARQDLRDEVDDLNERAARAHREQEQERERRDKEKDRPRQERREPEPPTEATVLLRAMDQQVLDHFEGPLRRLAGLEFTERHGAAAMMANGQVDAAAERYRQRAHAAIEDLVEAMRDVSRLDDQLLEALPRQEKAFASVVPASTEQATPDPTLVSRPQDIATVNEELQECARALQQLTERLPDVRLALREGRMTPDDERQGSMGGFQRTWTKHLEEVREDLAHARRTSEDIARQLRELDERGAREVRRTFRGQ